MMKRIFVASPWRCFTKAATPFSRHCGFTIIEVSLSLVLLAMSVALSLPSYREMVEKRQSNHGAEQIEMHSHSQGNRLDLTVGNTGQVVLCENNANHTIPPHNTCPDRGVQR